MDTRIKILSKALKHEAVTIPEWDVTVHVSTMSGHERAAWHEVAFDDEGKAKPNCQATLLVHCLRDDTGKRLFTAEDVDALAGKESDVLLRLFIIAKRLNGLGDAAEEEGKN